MRFEGSSVRGPEEMRAFAVEVDPVVVNTGVLVGTSAAR
jgi:hypothetical protein